MPTCTKCGAVLTIEPHVCTPSCSHDSRHSWIGTGSGMNIPKAKMKECPVCKPQEKCEHDRGDRWVIMDFGREKWLPKKDYPECPDCIKAQEKCESIGVCKNCGSDWPNGQIECPCKKAQEKTEPAKWEMFFDPSYYDLWAVRRIGDKDFNSPSLFHFIHKSDAEAFKQLAEISQ